MDTVRWLDVLDGVMTAEVHTPARPELARELGGRGEAAAAAWRAPVREREGAPEGTEQAARYAITVDTQALRRIVARLRRRPGRTLVGDDGCQAAPTNALNSDHDSAFQRPA
jgi:hypothetical protein